MNDTSLESYCNVLYEFFCYRVTWFFCWRQQFFSNFRYFACGMIQRHLMPFHKMSKFKSGMVPHVMVHILTKFGSDWAIFYLFISSNVHSFFSSSLCCIWSPIFKLLQLLNHLIFLYKWPLVRKLWCCSLWIFMFVSGNACICEPNIYI